MKPRSSRFAPCPADQDRAILLTPHQAFGVKIGRLGRSPRKPQKQRRYRYPKPSRGWRTRGKGPSQPPLTAAVSASSTLTRPRRRAYPLCSGRTGPAPHSYLGEPRSGKAKLKLAPLATVSFKVRKRTGSLVLVRATIANSSAGGGHAICLRRRLVRVEQPLRQLFDDHRHPF